MALICATIGRGRHSSLIEEWKAAAEAGVDLVELRIDCLRRDADLKRILADRPTPLIFTIRRGADGGLWRGQEERRQQLLREAIVMGVDYVDLELDVASNIRRYGKTQRIVSYHNLKGTPSEIQDTTHQCDEMDADVVKIATMAHTLPEACRVMMLAEGAKVPTVAIAMGEIGFFTRILGAKYGAPFTYSGYNPERIFAAGMPMASDLKRDYHYNEINAETQVFGVIGDPIGHSLSPAIHNTAFRDRGINAVLVPFLIPKGTLADSLRELDWLGVRGYSVTIPHKEAVVPLLDQKDGAVERTDSCNTLVFEDGKKVGYNTDYRAAMDVLEDAMGGRAESEDASPLFEKQVLLLGAGGVARAIAFGVSRRGASITITNRHDERATRLAEEVGARTINWGQRASTLADVIVNCTPVGMHPNVDDTPVPPAAFSRKGMVAFDTVYHPENTMFLKLAKERECLTVTGVDMFIHQAAHQFKLYTGQDAPLDLMREVVRRRLGPIRE
ncbi:MAG: shikimate dehydrogenase [Isosphaeraceae bacterium]